MNVVIYARYSSHNQTEQSIEGQIKVCKEFAKKNGYIIVGEYIDRAESGRSANRPQFLKMIEDSKKRAFQGVLVYQLDRFSRDRYDSAIYKNKLKNNDVRVFSANESISSDASGILMESVLEGMAEYYSAELSEKTTRGLMINAEKCLYNGGVVALGYKVGEDKRFYIDEEKADLVRRIFELYCKEDNTMIDVMNDLNDKGEKTVYGNPYNKSSVKTILTNKSYIGIYRYNIKDRRTGETHRYEIEGGMPKIVDRELFELAQSKLNINSKSPARGRAKEDYLLTTKLFCGQCKEMMTGISGTSSTKAIYHYYSCNGKRTQKKCKQKNIPKDYIEDIVVEQARRILTDEVIDKVASEIGKILSKDNKKSDVEYLEKKITKLEKQKDNLIDSLKECENSDMRKDIFAKYDKLEEEKNKISEEIAKIKIESNLQLDENQIRFFLYNLKDGNINNKKYKKLLISVFVNKVFLYERHIDIVFNVSDEINGIEIPDIEQIESSYMEGHEEP